MPPSFRFGVMFSDCAWVKNQAIHPRTSIKLIFLILGRPCGGREIGAPRLATWQLKSALGNSVSAAPRTIISKFYLQLLLVDYFFI